MLTMLLAIVLAVGDAAQVADEFGRQAVAANRAEDRAERPCAAQPVPGPQETETASISAVDACFVGLPWGCAALGIVSTVLLWSRWRSQRRG